MDAEKLSPLLQGLKNSAVSLDIRSDGGGGSESKFYSSSLCKQGATRTTTTTTTMGSGEIKCQGKLADEQDERQQQEEQQQQQRSREDNSNGSLLQHSTSNEITSNIFYSFKEAKISWKCGVCGYHVLAMDHEGKPIPLPVCSLGDPLPMSCPRCLLEHTSWEQAVPFGEHGDHVNIRSKLSNNYVHTTAALGGEPRNIHPAPTKKPAGVRLESVTLPPVLQEIGRWTFKEGNFQPLVQSEPQQREPHKAYYCGKCNRKLLRIDAYGELVPMIRGKDGSLLPIVCPGCKEEHNQWDVKPYKVGW